MICSLQLLLALDNHLVINRAIQTELTASTDLLRYLATITVGTTRGILHDKTGNTRFNKYQLSTINVTEMINKDSVFRLNRENA
jgi:hypothetical protein